MHGFAHFSFCEFVSGFDILIWSLRACLKIPWESCFRRKGRMARHDEGGYPQRSLTEEQRSQTAFSAKTLRAAGLLSVACVGSPVTARCGDAPGSPPWPQPKSLAAGPHAIFRQALKAPGSADWLQMDSRFFGENFASDQITHLRRGKLPAKVRCAVRRGLKNLGDSLVNLGRAALGL